MKKKFLFFSLAIAFVGLCFTPRVFAEEVEPTQTVEEVVNSTETTTFVEKTYVYDMFSIKLVSENQAVVIDLETLEATDVTYSISNNVLMLGSGEEAVMFTISENGTLTPYEEKVTINEMAEDFLNKWLTIILSFFTGVVGSGGVIIACNVLVRRLTKRLEDGVDLSNDERVKLASDIGETRKTLLEYKEGLNTQLLEIKNVVPELLEDFKELKTMLLAENKELLGAVENQTKTINTLKDLICKLVASNPSLASNGYATQIIALCDGFSKGGVNDEQNK